MRNKILFFILFLPFIVFAQTKEEREKIASFSNKEANEKLEQELKNEEIQRKARLDTYFAANPEAKKILKDDKTGKIEIMDALPNGEIVYAKTDNAGAATTARTTFLYNGGSLGLNVQGQGMTAAVWDGGSVLNTHQEFMINGVSKIQLMDAAPTSDHSTHVAGTIAAKGIMPSVRGIAFNSSLKSYDWNEDLTEMLLEASTGLLVSNHSYGMGMLNSIWFFGAYDSRAKQMDEICYNNPFYLPVVSAGNSRNLTTAPASTQINNKFGYDLIYGHANAKNVLTVAAVNEVSNYNDAGSVTMSSFSSYGPSDDGRIKPEISMKGVQVQSTLNSSDYAVGYMSGTSMASPGITGVVTLLQQYYNHLYNNWMKSATVKGLILHTADEAGTTLGPDYKFGWGLVNAASAAKVIRDKNLNVNGSFISELKLVNGSTYTKTISASGLNPLKISISWTDPAYSSPNNGVNDPNDKYLLNDLDVKVTGSNGTIYYPWKLQGMNEFWIAATNTATNNVDNFERVDIENPFGSYTITVSHKGILTGGAQNFSLIITSDELNTLAVEEINDKKGNILIYPNPTSNLLTIKNLKSNTSEVVIFDTTGKLVLKTNLNKDILDVRSLVPGTYFMYIKNRFESKKIKFIKK